jgi:fibronectin type 3 domain-containing protein
MRGSRSILSLRSLGVLPTALAILALGSVAVVSQAASPTTTLISVRPDGIQGDYSSFGATITPDGRYVAFASAAQNFDASGDTNWKIDIFVKDTTTGVIQRCKSTTSGAEPNGNSYLPKISADGRYVAFYSDANNFVAGDNNFAYDIFRWDRQTNTVALASISSSGTSTNHNSDLPSISEEGRYVAFLSFANNLVSGDTNGQGDIFVRDMANGTTERVSLSPSGGQSASHCRYPSMSANGRYVSFQCEGNDLTPGDTNNAADIYVRDRVSNTTELVSVTDNEQQANSSAQYSAVSNDGRYVVFNSWATNLVAGDTNGYADVFRRDRVGGTTVRVSVNTNGTQKDAEESAYPAISSDGMVVAFASNTFTIDEMMGFPMADPQYASVYDFNTGVVAPLSIPGGNVTGDPTLSTNGRWIVFTDNGYGFPGDTNWLSDIFLYDRNPITLGTPVLTAAASSSSSILLSWTDGVSVDYDGYIVERADAAGNFSEIGRVNASTFTYTDSGLTPGLRYIYRLRSYVGTTISRGSNKGIVTLAPTAPANLVLALENRTRVRLTWGSVFGVTSFQVERAMDGGGYSPLATVAATVLLYRDATLQPDRTYAYRVRAVNAAGSSAYSNAEQVTTLPNPPTAPTGLAANAVTRTSVALTWTDTSSVESGYRVWRWDAGTAVYTLINTTVANATSYTDTSVAAGTRYVYYVTAFNVSGSSSGCTKVIVQTPAL